MTDLLPVRHRTAVTLMKTAVAANAGIHHGRAFLAHAVVFHERGRHWRDGPGPDVYVEGSNDVFVSDGVGARC